jgi:hypothetical protein
LSLIAIIFVRQKHAQLLTFSIAGNTIPKQHFRSYQAIQNDTLCYCFDIDAEQYLSSLNVHRAEPIKAFVIQRTKVGECACEIRNPSG